MMIIILCYLRCVKSDLTQEKTTEIRHKKPDIILSERVYRKLRAEERVMSRHKERRHSHPHNISLRVTIFN
jgi:hypothetical protein